MHNEKAVINLLLFCIAKFNSFSPLKIGEGLFWVAFQVAITQNLRARKISQFINIFSLSFFFCNYNKTSISYDDGR
jgi:hypothetical protein